MRSTAWELFTRNFKLGDEVFVIDDDDGHAWGKLKAMSNRGFHLQRPGYTRSQYLYWDAIRFISHDGFPVRELFGADGSATIEDEPNAKTVIRRAMQGEFASIVFGDPFLIEHVHGILHNPGNDGPEWNNEDGEECLELAAADGARGLLWHLPTVFHVERN